MAQPATNSNTKASQTPLAPQKQEDFFGAVISYLGIPDTLGNRAFLVGWAKVENTKAHWNPLATTLPEPGATNLSGNPAGVKEYPNAQTGAKATADTIRHYPNIYAAL